MAYAGATRCDPQVVDAEQFRDVIAPIRARFEEEHDRAHWGRHAEAGSAEFMGTLAERTGINVRRLNGYFRAEWPLVPLCDVDEILVALDRPELLQQLDVLDRRAPLAA